MQVAANLLLRHFPQKLLARYPVPLGVLEFLLSDPHEQSAVIRTPGLVGLWDRSLLLRCPDEAFQRLVDDRSSIH